MDLDAAERSALGIPAQSPVAVNGQQPDDEIDPSWKRIDLGPILRGKIEPIEPTILQRDDGRAMFYAGCVNGVHGDSGDGKSMAVELAAAQEINAGHHVIWIDLEDPDGSTIVERLRLLGVSDEDIEGRLHYHRPVEPFADSAVEHIVAEAIAYGVTLIVLDSLGEAFGLDGIDEDRDAQVGPWLRRVARRLADVGPAVVLIDHSTKAKDAPLFPSGSKRKRAAITGAAYLLEAPEPLTKERGGRLRLTCAKDRHGNWRRGEHVAEIVFTVYPDGGVTVHCWAPSQRGHTSTPEGQLRRIAVDAVRAVKEADHPLTQREVKKLMRVKASAVDKGAGIDTAIAGGALRVEPGKQRRLLHHYVRDLQEEPGE